MSALPDWVSKHKKKGIAIEHRKGRYYATRVGSVWDPEKKRARKQTIEYLGVVKPEGILPPKHKRDKKIGSIRESGNISLLNYFSRTLIGPLCECWPGSWQSILTTAVLKLAYLEPLKRISFRYRTSLASQIWPDAHVSKNSLTSLLESIGSDWGSQRAFFKLISKADSYLAIDLTHVFSDSQNMTWLEIGHNAEEIWHDQLHLLLLWGLETHFPGFLKVLPGSVTSAPTMTLAIRESGLKNVVVVGDKGFYSKKNVEDLENLEMHYMLALKRDLSGLQHPAHSRYTDHFIYRKAVQWWREYTWNDRRIVHFLDKQIAAEEENIYFRRIHEGVIYKQKYSYYKNRFGTLAILTDLGVTAEDLYKKYKQRREIEQAFDSLKNTLKGDKTWMQSRESIQGYYFILFVALHIYCQILDHLRRKDLLNRYSVRDVITQLSKIYNVEINGNEYMGDVTKSTRRLLKLLELPITENLGS